MTRPRIVIVGAGFGGLFAAQALSRVAAEVTIIDRHNYHLFQPLLYQVATAGLPPSDVAWPIRAILRRQRNATVLLGEVVAVDVTRRVVDLRDRSLSFDYLVVATGSTHSYFGHEDWRPFAPGLKSIDDATRIRGHILRAFEAAEMETDAARRERLLRRGCRLGPTGVKLRHDRRARALHARRGLPPHRPAQREIASRRPARAAAFKEPQSGCCAARKLGVEFA
jgi:NADH dehydrogenase